VGPASPVANAAHLPGSLQPHPQATQQEGLLQLQRSPEVLWEGAEDRQVFSTGPLPLCTQLAPSAHPQLHHLVLPLLRDAAHPHLHRHLPHPRQLSHEPHRLRLQDQEVPDSLPADLEPVLLLQNQQKRQHHHSRAGRLGAGGEQRGVLRALPGPHLAAVPAVRGRGGEDPGGLGSPALCNPNSRVPQLPWGLFIHKHRTVLIL